MSDTIYHLYKHTSKTSGKSYIGITTNLERRWYNHLYDSKNNPKYQFQKAIAIYGDTDWITEVICVSKSRTNISDLEIQFISEYNTFKEGYNMTLGGDYPPTLSGKDNGMYGKTHTDKVKRILAKTAAKRFKDKSYEELYGKEKSDHLKELRREQKIEYHKDIDTTGSKNSNSKQCIIKGKYFETYLSAASYYNRSRGTIYSWVKKYDDCYTITLPSYQ